MTMNDVDGYKDWSKIGKYGNLTDAEVKEFFRFDWHALFPKYLVDRIEFKECVCKDCVHHLGLLKRDVERGEKTQARADELGSICSDQPQECRLVNERIYDRPSSFTTYHAGKPVHLEFKAGDVDQVWYCAACFFSRLIDHILDDLDGDERHIKHPESFPDVEANFAMMKRFYEGYLVESFPCRMVKSARDYILHHAEKQLPEEEFLIFKLWVEGHQQAQIGEKLRKSIGYVNTRLRRIREGPMGLWYEDFIKGEGKRSGHGEPDLIDADGIPVNLKVTGSKKTTKIKRDKLRPEIDYATQNGAAVRIRVYNIVHDREQTLEFAPLEIPVEIQVDW